MVGGRLVINNPEKSKDAGKYVCIAANNFGMVRSSEATLSFGCKLLLTSERINPFWLELNYHSFSTISVTSSIHCYIRIKCLNLQTSAKKKKKLVLILLLLILEPSQSL